MGDQRNADGDLLYGASEIAEHLGLTENQVRHQIRKGRIPVFRMGWIICSRKSTRWT